MNVKLKFNGNIDDKVKKQRTVVKKEHKQKEESKKQNPILNQKKINRTQKGDTIDKNYVRNLKTKLTMEPLSLYIGTE